ncbi:hypothetical protein ACS0TY_027087 [Phlomoides rotata]
MDPFAALPEDFVSEILSRTSPLDASRFSVVSKDFKSAVESDAVWDRFLPLDLSEILSRSVSPVIHATKKDLYSSLCHSPILLDAGKLSFSLDKMSGKKCYMVGSRELKIVWSNTPEYWEWMPRVDSRFSEAAELKDVCRLDIRGKIKTQMLSWDTNYGAYLVFKLAEEFYGLESANAVVRFVNDDGVGDVEERNIDVHLQRVNARYELQEESGAHPVKRDDGWMEIEMGRFYNDQQDGSEVEAQLRGIDAHHWKSGLIVEGIEFRPKRTQYRPYENDEGESSNMIR